jgi:integrase-like protein
VHNAFVEWFNSKLRDECLNEHVFLTLAEARETIDAWRADRVRVGRLQVRKCQLQSGRIPRSTFARFVGILGGERIAVISEFPAGGCS